jgi:beta-phosphoglucomutase-like phosphatase (HAD superfamily)
MKLFLSHAVTDKKLAISVKRLIQDISMGLIKVWQSSAIDGLMPGDVLWDEVHDNLSKSDKIITLITPNSIDRPWLTYESGYVAGKQGSQVIPLLYSLKKNELPSPLSAYVVYYGHDKNDLETLLMQLMSAVAPNPSSILVSSLVDAFIKDNETTINALDKSWNDKKQTERNGINNITYLSKLEASELFHKKLADSNIHLVQILTYTNEVEVGSITTYRVKGKKRIEVYKRSILSDLRQQQRVNLLRLSNDSKVKLWDKKRKSIDASEVIEREFTSENEVVVIQYFFDSPPVKRVYMFDESEAIISYYEAQEDYLNTGGSIYKGMESSKSVYVDKTMPIGVYVIGELLHYIHSLRVNSRSWDEEKKLINGPKHAPRWIQMPCLGPKAVFVDLDGVLYDSLPQYEKAWTEGFKEIGFSLPAEEVYLQEGRSGESTVVEIVNAHLGRKVSEEEISVVIAKKKDMINALGVPPIQSGAKELLKQIKRTGLPIFVVTGSTKEGIKERIIEDFPEIENISRIITGNDVRYGKPNPEPYLLACEKAGLGPSEVVVIENAPLGARSAVEAGCLCIGVNTGPLDNKYLLNSGATIVFSTCGELAAKWERVLKILKS